MCRPAGNVKRLQILGAGAVGHRIGHIDHRLRRLPDRDGSDHALRQRIDRHQLVLILKFDVHAGPITRRPDAMRQLANRNGRNLRKIVGAKDVHLVEAPYGDVRESSARRAREVHVIGDRPRVDRCQ